MAVYKNKNNNTWYFKTENTTRRGFATKKEAKIAEMAFKSSSKSINFTVDELFTEYLLMLKSEKSRSSYISVKGHYNNNIKNLLGNKKIDRITPRDIMLIKTRMIDRGCAAGYINTIITIIKTVFNYAVKMDYLEKSPCKSVSRVKNIKSKNKLTFWTPEQFVNVVKYEVDFTYYCLFNLLYYTGMRVSEAKALWWNDIDLDKKVICISHHIIYKGYTSRELGRKNGGEHTILIPKKLLEILYQLKEYDMSIDGYSENSFIFGVIRPLPMNTSQRHLDKCAKLSGNERLHIHGLRHSHASFLINHGATPFEVAHRLGDTVEVVLSRYAHLFNETEVKVVSIIDDYFEEM